MNREATIGKSLFAGVVAVVGLQCLVFTQFAHGLEPMPKAVPSIPWAWITGVALTLSGLSLFWAKTVRIGALVTAKLFLLSMLVLYVPLLIASLKNAADDALHTMAFGAAALILAAEITRRRVDESPLDRLTIVYGKIGMVVFGLCLIGFGIMHFVFFQFTADFVPAWIPLHRFWAAFTGVAQIAAGLAVLSGLKARLAATLSAFVYGSWVLVLHLPLALAHPMALSEWTDMLIAAGLSAGSLIVAGVFAGKTERPLRVEAE